MSLKHVIVVCGTTGSGKSSTSIEIAKKIGGEIVNSDAFQLYDGLNIATAKVTSSERGDVPHHLLSVLSPITETNVVQYRSMAVPVVTDILSRSRVPIIIGGTNFYLESVLFSSDVPPALAATTSVETPSEQWYSELQKLDPALAETIHPSDTRRIKRALEVTQCDTATAPTSLSARFPTILVHTTCDAALLKTRLNKRVDEMVEAGLVDEVRDMHHLLSTQSLPTDTPDEKDVHRGLAAAIGYKEMLPFLKLPPDAEHSDVVLAECIQQVKTNTIKYAKRQNTWLRNRLFPMCQRLDIPIFTIHTDNLTLLEDQIRDVVASIKNISSSDSAPAVSSALYDDNHMLFKRQIFLCDVCDGRSFQGQRQYDIHLASRTHKKRVEAKHKRQRNEESRQKK